MTFETCMLMSRTHLTLWETIDFLHWLPFTIFWKWFYPQWFCNKFRVLSKHQELQFLYLVHFTDSKKGCNCLDHCEHSWINSLSFFPSFLFCCFIFDLRCWTRVWLKYLVYCYFPHFNFVAIFLLTLYLLYWIQIIFSTLTSPISCI